MSEPTTLRERTQEINAEYWSARDQQTERVAVAQLCLALASAERDAAGLREAQAAGDPALREAIEGLILAVNRYRPGLTEDDWRAILESASAIARTLAAPQPAAAPRETALDTDRLATALWNLEVVALTRSTSPDRGNYGRERAAAIAAEYERLAPAAASAEPREGYAPVETSGGSIGRAPVASRAEVAGSTPVSASPSPGREVAWLIERGYPERPGPTVWWSGGGAPERAWHWTEDAYSARRFPTREAAQHEIDFQAGPHAGALPWGRPTEHVFIAAASAELADERPEAQS